LGITWAVIDSGIDGAHAHFGSNETREKRQKSAIYHSSVAELHRDFTGDDEVAPGSDEETTQARLDSAARALTDGLGHGSHVAGIIAGGLPKDAVAFPNPAPENGIRFAVFEQVFEANLQGERLWSDKLPVRREIPDPEAMHGVAPRCTLVSLTVLDKDGNGRVSDIMRALVYVREQLNDDPKMLRVHGVNLSVGYDFDAQMFACGQSPLCVEVDRLVRSGVVVVTAAGNTGYGSVNAAERQTKAGLSNTINDPGNASLAITVGSTHRDSPHTYGVSFFSSKGPTGDGRLKPDLVAPGERITSCASQAKCEKLGMKVADGVAAYVDDSGTSMAAPHVSGAIAAFLSIRREFIQRPEEVKRIFLSSATSLGRERYFEGHGLVDLMRAIQSV
jgi:subtilisin family serine protease